jgi:protein-S-isoprenylcysteine O-methyltransferase Ste14
VSQQWVQVVGLTVEFVGVLLLAWEWFTAERQERAERALAEAQGRREESMAGLQRAQPQNPQMQRHFEMSRDMDRRMTAHRVDTTRRQYRGMRVRTVVAALVLVAAGFVLQMLGSWPGCCRAIGVLPLG